MKHIALLKIAFGGLVLPITALTLAHYNFQWSALAVATVAVGLILEA
jgi:hypothetical protein